MKFRPALTAALLLVLGVAQSQPVPPVHEHQPQAPQADAKAGVSNKSSQPAVTFSKQPVDKQAAEKNEWQERSGESGFYAGLKKWLIKFIDDPIATFTGLLFIATVLLWIATKNLWKDAKRSADVAFVASMPLLSPLIIWPHTRLHPLSLDPHSKEQKFTSHVSFVFENFGKTPGIIRELRAKVFLCSLDEFPDVDFEELPLIGYEPIIPPDARGEDAAMGVAECNTEFSISETELRKLHADAHASEFSRMALIGMVVYDDFVGVRHTRNFCVKMRNWRDANNDEQVFHLVRGRDPFNRVTRKKIPRK